MLPVVPFGVKLLAALLRCSLQARVPEQTATLEAYARRLRLCYMTVVSQIFCDQ